jgi:glucosamine kinase
MILIADSGSTKTEWVLLGGKGFSAEYTTRGVNPYFLSVADITTLFQSELIPQLSGIDLRSVHNVFYYGAGCSSEEKCAMVQEPLQSLFPAAVVAVTHDLLGAARAGCGSKEGIAVILGTGSNSCLFDGEKIVANQPSLGFILGDEGSGGYIGKELLKQFLYHELPLQLHEAFVQEYQLSKEQILNKVYKEPMPNTFAASFTPFVAKHLNTDSMQQLVLDAFDVFFKRHISAYPNHAAYPISVIGSVGFVFKQQLQEIAARYHTHIQQLIQKPMDGLIRFHQS